VTEAATTAQPSHDGKRCPRCMETKSFSAFYRVVSRSDGYASWCKHCTNSTRKFHGKQNPKHRVSTLQEVPASASITAASAPPMPRLEPGHILWGCDWCCEERVLPEYKAKNTRFCSQGCRNAWASAAESRRTIFEGVASMTLSSYVQQASC